MSGQFTCERPGEGAGWGAEGGPVIGCGALFISRGSACGGRCGPVWTERKRKCRQRQEVKNDGVAVGDAAGGPTEPAQVQITGHYRHNVEFLQDAEIKQPLSGHFLLLVTSGIQHTRVWQIAQKGQKYTFISITAHHKAIKITTPLYLLIRSRSVCLLLLVRHLYGSII